MSAYKCIFRNTYLLLLCFILCLSLFGCTDYDDKVLKFYHDTESGAYNAIKFDFGDNNSGIYYIHEGYGVWSYNESKYLFDFDYYSKKHGGGQLMICVATKQSYYESIVQQNNGFASFYYGKTVFSGKCEFSNDGTVATISPDHLGINEMFIDSDRTVTLLKTSVYDSDSVPLDVAFDNMNYVPDSYLSFLVSKDCTRLLCETVDLWVDASTMTGECNMNGSIIPVRMAFNKRVPYVEVYDVSGSSEKILFKSYANVIDESTIELVEPKGELFYTIPSSPVTIKKAD